MTVSHATDADGPSSWLFPFFQCCAPLASCLDRKPRRSKSTSLTTSSTVWPLGRTSDQDLLIDKDQKVSRAVVCEQPTIQGGPVAEFESESSTPNKMEKPRKSFASGRTVSTLKKRFRSDGSACRPQISAPSDFRHLETGSFQFPPLEPPPVRTRQDSPTQSSSVRPRISEPFDLRRVESGLSQCLDPEPPLARPRQDCPRRPSSFRPLELSIYMPDNHVSPILPHFEYSNLATPPQPAHLQERLDDDHQLIRQRSNSSTPFHLPMKVITGTASPSMLDNGAPVIPAKSQARARAHTSPELETIKARVAGAMVEVERLQKQIDNVVERQSLCANSRPSTSHSMTHTKPELEPMPSIPALPPAAPSFAERLNSDIERPQTAPLKTAFEISNRSQEFGDGKSVASSPTHGQYDDPPPPPPLPLVLRPPLRKKKSFSRVSTWLFPNGQHNRDVSLDSITNLPRPVKGTEGFYQCVAPGDQERRSFESVGTVTTWDSEEEQRTIPTTLSPGSTPITKQDGPRLERTATFGKSNAVRPQRPAVGAMG